MRPDATSAFKRPLRRGATLWPLLPIVALACGPSNLPDDQLLTSPHFRYHARADTVLDPTIMDRLETHRSELDGYLGIDSGVVDYYRYSNVEDRFASTGCEAECTQWRSIYAVTPFQEHELVHALLADVNQTALVLEEGTAQYFTCLWPQMAPPTPPADWPGIGSSGIFSFDHPDVIYPFGQRLVSWMSQTGGVSKMLDFYREALQTSDAAVFALQFERFWGRRLGDVAGDLLDQRFASSFCPCAAPALPADGSATSFVAGQDYRTLDVAEESRLELSNDGQLPVIPFGCANTIVDGPTDIGPTGAVGDDGTLTVARVGPGRYGVTAESVSGETVTMHQTLQATSDWSCAAAAAHPIAVGKRQVTAWVTSDFADDENWFAFNLDRPTGLDLLNPESDIAVCLACSPECGSTFAGGARLTTLIPLTAPASGPLLIKLRRLPGQPATNLGLRLRPLL